MSKNAILKSVSVLLLVIGFLVPFVASGFKGMPLTANPAMLAVNALLWVAGLAVGYRAFAAGRSADGTGSAGPAWRTFCAFVTATSATWLMLGIVLGFVYSPTISASFFGTNFNAVLMITLAVMGLQITGKEWRGLARNVKAVSVVVLLRWLIMPLLGYCLSYIVFRPFLPADIANSLAIGMILLCTSPTGAASNSMTLISRGDLALSVSATTVNVLIAPFLQPPLVQLMAGAHAKVDTYGMFLDLLTYVLAPVVIASIIGTLFPRAVESIKPVLAPIAVISLACVLMGTVAKGTAPMLAHLSVLAFILIACVVQGVAGLLLGYFAPRFFGFTREQRIASCFEVGVENAGIAPVIAAAYFSPLAILPAVVYGKTQNLIGVLIFVRHFQKQPAPEPTPSDPVDA